MIRHAWIGAHADVTQKRQCVLVGVSRTTVYVKRKPVVFVESDEVLKRLIDEEFTQTDCCPRALGLQSAIRLPASE